MCGTSAESLAFEQCCLFQLPLLFLRLLDNFYVVWALQWRHRKYDLLRIYDVVEAYAICTDADICAEQYQTGSDGGTFLIRLERLESEIMSDIERSLLPVSDIQINVHIRVHVHASAHAPCLGLGPFHIIANENEQ